MQITVYPRVIDCPDQAKGTDTLYGVAKSGIQVRAKARVTARTNLEQRIGGATEESVIARVGEGVVGSSTTDGEVFESPRNMFRAVLAQGLDSQTAFEIVSLDIADVAGGDKIGARRPTRPRPICGAFGLRPERAEPRRWRAHKR